MAASSRSARIVSARLPVVWVSGRRGRLDRGRTSRRDVFSDAIPTSGALGGPGMLVVGSAVSTQAAQRAIWESTDGTHLDRVTGRVGEARDQCRGPDDGERARRASSSGGRRARCGCRPTAQTWTPGDIGRQGVTDVAVDADGFVAVGQSGSNASWSPPRMVCAGARPRQQPAAAGTRSASSERTTAPRPSGSATSAGSAPAAAGALVEGCHVPRVPDPAFVVGGQADLAAIGSADRRRHVSGVDLGRHGATG